MRPSRLISIIAVLVQVAIVFIIIKQTQKSPKIDEIPTTVSGIAPTPVVAETDDWRDYKNLEFNYAFRYPREWTVSQVLPTETDILEQTVLTSVLGQTVTVMVVNNPNKLNSAQMGDKFTASISANVLEKSKINIGGFEGEKINISRTSVFIAVTKGSWTYRINLSPYSAGDSNEAIYAKILDTFNFI